MEIDRHGISTDRIKIISKLVTSSATLVASLNSSAKRNSSLLVPIIAKLKSAKSKIKTMSRTKGRIEADRRLDILCNSTISLSDAIQDCDVETSDLKEFKKEFGEQALLVKAALSSLLKERKEKSAQEEETGGSEVEEELRRQDRQKHLDKIDRSTISRYNTFKSKLPTTGKVPRFALLNMPVLAKFVPFLTKEDLDDAGFDVDMIDLYPVLKDQTVLVINMEYVKRTNDKNNKEAEKASDRQNLSDFMEAYIEEILHTLKLKTHKTYHEICSFGYKPTPGFTYRWLMSEAEVTHLKSIKSKKANVEECGFPFR